MVTGARSRACVTSGRARWRALQGSFGWCRSHASSTATRTPPARNTVLALVGWWAVSSRDGSHLGPAGFKQRPVRQRVARTLTCWWPSLTLILMSYRHSSSVSIVYGVWLRPHESISCGDSIFHLNDHLHSTVVLGSSRWTMRSTRRGQRRQLPERYPRVASRRPTSIV